MGFFNVPLAAVVASSVVALGACAVDDIDLIASESLGLASPGRWAIPADTLAAGDSQWVKYTDAGPWVGEEACGGGILPGADDVREYIYEYFPQVHLIGGYSCRPINGDNSQMSVHATGRALDLHIRTIENDADNDLGDPIGNWLIENAEYIGIQFIIWDLTSWGPHRPPGDKDKAYGGAHPHNDHLHIELSVDSAARNTAWHKQPKQPPVVPTCGIVPADGAIIDNGDNCSQAYGPSEYWRTVEGVGFGGSLSWTNAFENDTPSNWGRWSFDFDRAGDYLVEVYVVPDYSVYDKTHYEIRHAGQIDALSIDPGSTEGWITLGEFYFDAGPYQDVRLHDNVLGAVDEDQRIAFDALRVTPTGTPPNSPGEPEETDRGSGCNTGGNSSPDTSMLVLLGVAMVLVRRRG